MTMDPGKASFRVLITTKGKTLTLVEKVHLSPSIVQETTKQSLVKIALFINLKCKERIMIEIAISNLQI